MNSVNSNTYSNSSQVGQSGGMKRRAETPNNPEAKRFRAEDLREEGPLVNLLTELWISIIQQATFVQLEGFSYSCKKFHSLVLTHVDTIHLSEEKDVCRLPILKKMAALSKANLKVFVIWVSTPLQPHNLLNDKHLSLLSQFSNLSVLILGKDQVTNLSREGLLQLTALQKLSHLELNDCKMEASAFTPVLSALPNLTNLRIKGLILDESLLPSLTTTSLQRLGLWAKKGGYFLESDFAYLSNNIGLKELILADCHADIQDSFKYISHLTRLERLSIYSDSISNQQVAKLKTLTNLNSLHLGGCWHMNDEGASDLIELKKMTHLGITRSPHITGAFFKKISVLELKSLQFYNCVNIQDQDLETLCSIPTLQVLDLQRSNQLTNRALENIAKHSCLRTLTLGTLPQINDEGIRSLIQMKNLSNLFVMKCENITRIGIDFLLDKHPNNVVIKFTPAQNPNL
jgi:hypothetical protein